MALTLTEASRLLWCPGLVKLKRRPTGSLQEWLSGATYAPTANQKGLRLIGIDSTEFLSSWAADINRLSLAGSETLRNIVKIEGLQKSLGWPYVKLYYGALFYTHALLRVWGRAPSYFRSQDLQPLRDMLYVYGVAPTCKLQTGQFLVCQDLANSAIELQPIASSGGSHEAVWRQLALALDELRTSVVNGPFLSEDAKRIDFELKALRSLMTDQGRNTSWPSLMRNNIQYRSGEGLWYPYRGKLRTEALQQEIRSLMDGETNLQACLKTSGAELDQFRSACSAIIVLTRSIISDMARIGGSHSFVRYGTMKFEDSL